MHALAMKTSDSHWHKQLSKDAAESSNGDGDAATRSPYWLHPFQQYQTFCPYLVGSYERVADELAHYFTMGDRALIVDIPREEYDLVHANRVLGLVGAGSALTPRSA
jgi:alkanesulfonate monooxygenase